MITPGEVQSVRELTRGVQARVCLGADSVHGDATVTVTSSSPAVRSALADLKAAIRAETLAILDKQLEGQRRWDEERERS